jgi:hypothetical protein
MDKSNPEQERMGVIHYAPRQNHNTITTPLHIDNDSPERNIIIPTTRDGDDGGRIPLSSQRPRTDGDVQVTSPDILRQHGPSIHHSISHKHIQQDNSPEDIFIDYTNPQPSTSFSNHSGRNRKHSPPNLSNKRPRNTSNSPPRKSSKKRTPTSRRPKSPTMDNGTDRNIFSRSPTPTTNNPSTDGNTNTDHDNIIYTFIIHKSGCSNVPPTTRRSPTFAAFDHGDHYHFIYTTRQTNNASRSLNTILQFLGTGFEGTTEAHTTLKLVHFKRRFIDRSATVTGSGCINLSETTLLLGVGSNK